MNSCSVLFIPLTYSCGMDILLHTLEVCLKLLIPHNELYGCRLLDGTDL